MKKRTTQDLKTKYIYYGLDIQKEYIAVVEYSSEINAVTRVVLQPVADTNSGVISNELEILKSKFKFLNSKINGSLPVENAIVRTFPIDTSENDVDNVLSWEFEQNTIASPDAYQFDYQPLETGSNNTTLYQLIGYRKERIEAFATQLKTIKLTPQSIDLDLLALINLFEISYPELKTHPALIIHGEATDLRIILTCNSKLLDFEYIRFDSEPQPDMVSQRILQIIPRLGTTQGISINTSQIPTFATGSLYSQDGFLESLKMLLPATTLLQPFKTVTCNINKNIEPFLPQLSIATGLAIRGEA